MTSDRKFLILLILMISILFILVIMCFVLVFFTASVINSNHVVRTKENVSDEAVNLAEDKSGDNVPKKKPTTLLPILHKDNRKAGERMVKTVNGVEFAFRWCPAGTFIMGSPKSEKGRFGDETQHQVTLTKGFWMMETEVTQKQWEAVMGNNPSLIQDDDLPVETVTWNDCKEFCEKCTQLGLPVQLPTEAQWEYACRAGTTGAYAGNLDEMAWYGKGLFEGGRSHPVGTKKPNAWGLYDMHGNVLEWCADWYDDYPSGSVTDLTGPFSGSRRIARGGCWGSNAESCRSSERTRGEPGRRYGGFGFRLVKGQ